MNARLDPRDLEPETMSDHAPDNGAEEARVDQLTLVSLVQSAQSLEVGGDPVAAAALYDKWISEAPEGNKHFALFNYGGVLQKLGKVSQAQTAYESCIAQQPDFAQPYINLGLLHEKQGRTTTALKTWLQLVELSQSPKPPATEFLTTALNHIGRLQEDLKNYQQAEQALERSLLLDPSQTDALQHWIHIRQKSCSWPIYKPLPCISYEQMRAATSPLAMLAITEDPAEQLAHSIAFVKRKFPLKEEYLSKNRQYNHERIRVGYVSADFREHAVGFLLPPFFNAHPKEDYELFGYDYTKEEDTQQRRTIKACFQHFKSIHSMTDREAAELILADEIDILVDLHGLSAGARPGIFALHPSPIQGTYLGFIGPTGMPWYDFVIADPIVMPPELTRYFTEKPFYQEKSFIPITQKNEIITNLTRHQFGIPEDAFVMAAFGNVYKITPSMFSTWIMLLHEIPNSVLWLIDDNETTTDNIRAEAIARKADMSRIFFTNRSIHKEYRAKLKLVNVFLDTFPYNCGATTIDFVQASIPMVTLLGRTMVSRMGASILETIGKNEYIANNMKEYVSIVKNIEAKREPFIINDQKIKNIKYQTLHDRCNYNTTDTYRTQTEKIKIYQIGYSNETATNLPENFILLNNIDNLRPDWREYWPIRNYLLKNELTENKLYGFFSPKFTQKTNLSYKQVSDFIEQDDGNSDVYIFSPFWDLNALFLNTFEQGDFFHHGLTSACQAFVDHIGLKLNLKTTVTHSGNTAFCNYIVGNKKFWCRWLKLGEQLFQAGEDKSNPIYAIINSETNYGAQNLPIKIFIAERLATLLLLQDSDITAKNFNIFQFGSSTTPLNQYLKEAIISDGLKRSYSNTRYEIYLNEFSNLRKSIIEKLNSQSSNTNVR